MATLKKPKDGTSALFGSASKTATVMSASAPSHPATLLMKPRDASSELGLSHVAPLQRSAATPMGTQSPGAVNPYLQVPSGFTLGTGTYTELQAASSQSEHLMYLQLKASDRVATKGWFIGLGLVMAALGIAYFATLMAWTPATRPYTGLQVSIVTGLPYWSLQFTSWNLSLASFSFTVFVGIAVALVTSDYFYKRIYDVAYGQYGVDYFLTAFMVITGPGVSFIGNQLCNVQDFFQLYLAVGLELARIYGLFMFEMENRRPLVALMKADNDNTTGKDWLRLYAGTRWISFAASVFFGVFVMPLYMAYGVTYAQQYGATTPRSVLAICWLVFCPVAQLVGYVLFFLRYGSAGQAGKNLRVFGVFGTASVFVSIFVPVVVLACLLFAPTVTTGY